MKRKKGGMTPPGENHLLALLPNEVKGHITPRLQDVSYEMKDVLYRRNGPIDHIYFPKRGVFSVLILMEDGSSIEVATVGNEGMLGVPALLGSDRSPQHIFCQVPAEAQRIRVDDFRKAVRSEPALDDLVHRYTQVLMTQISQSLACTHLHPVEARMARWLLMTHDRVAAPEFPLTQEFLSHMLGVRRSTVTVAAGMLQKAGLIAYHRGRITVLDRPGLEDASCECYRVVRDEFDRLLC
jgi:CRP-like cAMP-binding protein